MNKNTHILLILGDLFGIWLLWIGYSAFQRIPSEIVNQVDVIRFGNRIGYSIIGLAFPLFHIIALVDQFWKGIPKKIVSILNFGIYVLIVALLVAGFVGSSWLESQVENAGYVYCRRAGWGGAVSKTLVYTKDMRTCEDLVEEEKSRPRTKYKE